MFKRFREQSKQEANLLLACAVLVLLTLPCLLLFWGFPGVPAFFCAFALLDVILFVWAIWAKWFACPPAPRRPMVHRKVVSVVEWLRKVRRKCWEERRLLWASAIAMSFAAIFAGPFLGGGYQIFFNVCAILYVIWAIWAQTAPWE